MRFQFSEKERFTIYYRREVDLMHVECEGVSLDAKHLEVNVPIKSKFNPNGKNPPPRYYMEGKASLIKFNSRKDVIVID